MESLAGKSDTGKPRLSLVPTQVIRDIAQVREYGAVKYGSPDNWKDVEMGRYLDALYRHLLAVVDDPLSVDAESGLAHYKHVACNAAFLCVILGAVSDCKRSLDEQMLRLNALALEIKED
jgi:hypothetical protein